MKIGMLEKKRLEKSFPGPLFLLQCRTEGFDSIWNSERLINKQDTASFMWDN